MSQNTCAGCGAEVLWKYTPAGKRIPLDPKPVLPAPGTFVLVGEHQCRPSEPMFDDRDLDSYMTHFATCPDAELFRRSPAGSRAR